MNNSLKIEIDVEEYIDLLNSRRAFVGEHFNWKIPDCLWDYFLEVVRECGIGGNSSPAYVVDNVIVNGDYGDFDSYKEKYETDADFIERISDDVFYINEKERIVCYSL